MEDIDQNVYVISLDALDLNLLPTIYNTRDDRIAPLWTKSNLDRRNDEYYQFEIKSKDSEESVKDESPKRELENVICNICDIDVPKPFLKEHRKSSRHITNMKIADIAVHRMNKYINNTDNENCCTDCDEIDQSAHFCAACVTVVDAKDKVPHEKSLAHKNSVILEKIFNDFLLLYNHQEEVNDGKAEDEVNTNKNDSNTKLSDDVLKFVNVTDSGNTSNEVLKLIEKPIDAPDKTIKIKNNNEPTQAGIKEQPKGMPLSDYLSIINDLVHVPMFFKSKNNDNNFIEIETIDGSTVKVREDNFHGLNRVGTKHIQCYVCNKIFKAKSIDKHKMSEKHIHYMTAPLKDKHCARQIDDSSSHCVICNMITEYSDLHSLCDEDHEKNLKDALISDKFVEENLHSRKKTQKDTVLKDTTETEENDDKWIEVNKKKKGFSFTFASQNSVTTNESQGSSVAPNKFFCKACNEYISTLSHAQHYATTKHVFNSKSKYHYLMTEIENELFCIVCDVKVTNVVKDVKKHVYEMAHIKKYNQILAENKIKQLKDIFYCDPCDEVILFRRELIHIKEKSHQAKCFSDGYSVSEDEEIEKENYKMPIDCFHCDVCNVNVANYERNIQEHMNGKKHASNVKRSNPTSDTDDNDSDIPKRVSNIHYLMENTKFSTLLNCKVCKVVLLHNETWVRDHLASSKHKVNYKKLLKDNHLVLKKDNCYCNVCSISIGFKSELIHIGGKKHNRMVMQNLELLSSVSDPSAVIDSKVSTDNQNVSNHNMDTPSVFNAKDINNIEKPSVSNAKNINNIDKPLVSNVEDVNTTDEPSVSNAKYVNNVDKPSVSNSKDVNNMDKPSVSNAKYLNNIDKPSVTDAKYLNSIDKPSVSNAKDVNNTDMSTSDNKLLLHIEHPDIELEMLVLLLPTSNPKEVICKICEVTVPFNKHNVTTHMNGIKHKLAQKASLEEVAKVC
ncbi:putative histone-lysine N-methyltransferase 1 [Maniola hyperantus]|uniref:putative histone-lysine N-methyltransferase 1 n=1 Tax=Aphantopus hyperantus TaxID=2795564 RepID=UPI0037499498